MTNRDNTFRVVAIVGLVIGVMGLSIGFAAFSQTLTIKSAADVTPASNVLDIVFSTSKTAKAAGTVTPTVTSPVTAEDATINAEGTTISGLMAHFTKPGQTATYSFNVYNASAYVAYLNSVTFATASGGDSFKKCTAGTGTTQSYVDGACNGISVSVAVGDTSPYTRTSTEGTVSSGINHSLAATTGEAVTVTITYAAGSSEADGDFTVAFGDIILGYSSVQGS